MNVLKILNYNNTIFRSIYNVQQGLSLLHGQNVSPFRQFSSLRNIRSSLVLNSSKSFNPLVVPSCGMKDKGKLQLRCKDCYFERRDGEMYVFCSSYGRHKQHLRKKKGKKSSWILSYALQSKVKPY